MEPERPDARPISPTEIALRTGLCAPGLDLLREQTQLPPEAQELRGPLEQTRALVPPETGGGSPFPIYSSNESRKRGPNVAGRRVPNSSEHTGSR